MLDCETPKRPGTGPLAYLITFACYGARLHGDPDGSVDRSRNIWQAPMLEANPRRAHFERLLLRDSPTILSTVECRLVSNRSANRPPTVDGLYMLCMCDRITFTSSSKPISHRRRPSRNSRHLRRGPSIGQASSAGNAGLVTAARSTSGVPVPSTQRSTMSFSSRVHSWLFISTPSMGIPIGIACSSGSDRWCV